MAIALTDYLRTRSARLDSLSLSARFALTGSVVMIAAAIITGYWLTGVISRGVVSNTAGATALFMENTDSTILATALPTIARDLGLDPISLKLAVTSYLVSLAVFIPVSGWIADRVGARTGAGMA